MTAQIVRPLSGRIEIRSLRRPRTGEVANKQMFKTAVGAAIRPTWVPAEDGRPGWSGYWTISRKHLSVVAEVIAIRDGSVEIEMHYSDLGKCDSRCQNARGDDCTCSCEGKNHGEADHASWKPIGSTTLVKQGNVKVARRILTRKRALKQQKRRSN